jgi:hypothetical protein
MKPTLSIDKSKFPEIQDPDQRECVELNAGLAFSYHNDYLLNDGATSRESITTNQLYIKELFIIAHYCYCSQDYELSQRHFDLLNIAATYLVQLCQKKIDSLTTAEEQNEIRRKLAEYLDKVTLIFQTAADKTENEILQKVYGAKAQDYSAKADKVRGITQRKLQIKKMQDLYKKAAGQYPDGYFLQQIFQRRVDECREKCIREEAARRGPSLENQSIFASKTKDESSTEETQPLLGDENLQGIKLKRE